MNKITVIVPAYNAERTVGRTIESLLSQTCPVNIIVVDDGSTDQTAQIATKYPVRLLGQKNAGAYTARINGIQHVETTYFGFVDADDVVENEMYAKMVAFADKFNLDVVQCDYVGSKHTGKSKSREEMFNSRDEVVSRIVYPNMIEGVDSSFVWDKIYRTESCRCHFVDSTIMMGDDLAMNLQMFANVNRAGYLHEELYHYLITDGSSVRRFNSRMICDFCEIIRLRNMLIPKYEINVDQYVLNNWIVKNGWNYISSAITARVEANNDRATWIRKILTCPELETAVKNSNFCSSGEMDLLLMKLAYSLPIPVFVRLIRIMMFFKNNFNYRKV